MNNRIKFVLKEMNKQGLDCVVVTRPEDIYYLTGYFPLSFTVLIINDNIKLHVPKIDSTYAEEQNLKVDFEIYEKKPKIELNGRVGADLNHINANFYTKFLKNCEVVDFSILEFRAVKDKKEIRNIKKAIDISEKVMSIAEELVSESMTEKEICLELERISDMIAEKAFDFIVATAENSKIPHAKPSNRKIRDNVIVDLGVKYRRYCSDITRTFIFSEKAEEIYNAVIEAQKEAIKHIKAGVSAGDVDNVARRVLKEYGYDKNFIHSLGHGIGLSIHEKPNLSKESKDILKENMVITVEPGVYRDFGVRVEDVVLVKKSGAKVLSKYRK